MILGTALLAVGSYLVVNGVVRLREAWLVRSSKPVPVRELSVTDPPLEFEGTVEAARENPPFAAPFSGVETVLCEYRIVEDRGGDDERTLRHQSLTQPFVVTDGVARVTVDPTDAELSIGSLRTEAEGRGAEAFVGDWDAMEALGDSVDDLQSLLDHSSSRRRYAETRLDVGDPVHVYGGALAHENTEFGRETVGRVIAAKSGLFRIIGGDSDLALRWLVTSAGTALVVGLAFGLLGLGLLLDLL